MSGFGPTVGDSLRDLAGWFDKHQSALRGNSVGIEVAGGFIEMPATPGQSPSDLLVALATMIDERGYQEADFPEPDWERLAPEERVAPSGSMNN